MSGYWDCYILVESRSSKLADEFLAHFLPDHSSLAEDYEIPQYSDKPVQVFQAAADALFYLEVHPTEAHALYWANDGNGVARFGMIFPTSDGKMIYGLSCEGEDECVANKLLDAMKQYFATELGYIDFEHPPPDTELEFTEIVKSRSKK